PAAVSVPGEPNGAPVNDSIAAPMDDWPPGVGVGSIPAYVHPLQAAAFRALRRSVCSDGCCRQVGAIQPPCLDGLRRAVDHFLAFGVPCCADGGTHGGADASA